MVFFCIKKQNHPHWHNWAVLFTFTSQKYINEYVKYNCILIVFMLKPSLSKEHMFKYKQDYSNISKYQAAVMAPIAVKICLLSVMFLLKLPSSQTAPS